MRGSHLVSRGSGKSEKPTHRLAGSATITDGMKRSTLILVILLALVAIGIAAAISILHDGLSARATPTALEAWIARNARGLAIGHGARDMKNPVASSGT